MTDTSTELRPSKPNRKSGLFGFLNFGKSREQKLLAEVLEMSRNARMVSDKNGNSVLFNSKFANLCHDKTASINNLMTFFSDTTDNEQLFETLKEKALSGETVSRILQKTQDHSTRIYEVTAGPVSGGWNGYIHWRVEDVTAQRAQQERIRKNMKN